MSFALAASGCGTADAIRAPATTGMGCTANADCASGLCALDPPNGPTNGPWSGGYCTTDCATTACADGDMCRSFTTGTLAGSNFCLHRCTAQSDCRAGYQCFQKGCIPSCATDEDCGKGFGCMGGSCLELPGAAVGQKCATDDDCSSRDCDVATRTCQLACTRDDACPAGQTCFKNPVDTNGDGMTDAIRPICIPLRANQKDPGARCKKDGDCARGQCDLGVCVSMCEGVGACTADLACQGMFAILDDGAPKYRGCLPKSGVLDFDMGASPTVLGVPENAVSFALFTEAKNEDLNMYAGVLDIVDPMQNTIFSANQNFYVNPLRYQPSEGASMVIVSNSPLVKMQPFGVYGFDAFSETRTGVIGPYTVRAKVKLADSPIVQAGKIALHVFITNLAGGCKTFNASTAPTVLAGFEQEMRTIFAQAQITIDEIKYFDSIAPSTFTESNSGPSPQLDMLLKQATAVDTPQALELVIVKRIDSSGGGNFEVLGVAGGIPGSSGIPGTVHSGATASLTSLCTGGQKEFALTAAHELAHTLGLFHSVEQNGKTDQMTDDRTDGPTNLMYWEEGSTQAKLSPQQCTAILQNPVVRP